MNSALCRLNEDIFFLLFTVGNTQNTRSVPPCSDLKCKFFIGQNTFGFYISDKVAWNRRRTTCDISKFNYLRNVLNGINRNTCNFGHQLIDLIINKILIINVFQNMFFKSIKHFLIRKLNTSFTYML